MRQLRLLTRTDDGGHLLVETDDGLERFTLPLDATLRVAVTAPPPAQVVSLAPVASARSTGTQAPRQPNAEHEEPAPAQEIGPREIQVRVRAGESPDDLAEEHGMTLERVLRFAAPVVAERMRITDEAHRARARRTGAEGTEPTVVQFGEAVDERFAAHGIDASSVSWDSRRREDGAWLVAATWQGGDGEHGAEWAFHRGSRTVTPLDDAAADLLSDRPIRPVTPPKPAASAPRLASGVIAFPPFPDAHTGPIERVEHVFDQEEITDGPLDLPPYVPHAQPAAEVAGVGPNPEPARTSSEAPLVASTGLQFEEDLRSEEVLQFEEPPLPLLIHDPSGRPAAADGGATLHTLGSRREVSEEDKAARAKIPSWDDILLGVRRKQD